MNTSPTGSLLLACVGRGEISTHSPPTDNKGNAYLQVGTAHAYTVWTNSGTALYASAPIVGGASHVVTASKPLQTDETTLSVVEVLNGGRVQAVQWIERLAGQVQTSLSVTTTGPALLVAWWWGDDYSTTVQVAVPDGGFAVIDSAPSSNNFVQCFVATRQVAAAGNYSVTWTATPSQGAQLWLIAIQA